MHKPILVIVLEKLAVDHAYQGIKKNSRALERCIIKYRHIGLSKIHSVL
jgi:hypothetical protein